MKIIAALSSAVMLLAILGCASPAESPPASNTSEEEVQGTDHQATSEQGTITSMDFESGDIPEEADQEAAVEPTEETQHTEGDGEEE